MDKDDLEIKDTSGLTDADWSAIGKLKAAHEAGGDALEKAMDELMKGDPVRSIKVLGAFFPEMVSEAIKDQMAELGMDADDLKEIARKAESPARDQ